MKYIFYKTAALIMTLLPRPVVLILVSCLGSLTYYFARGKRKIIKTNLQALHTYSENQLSTITKNIFKNFFIIFADFCRFRYLNGKTLSKIIAVDTVDNMHALLAQKKGAIVLTAHLGHWELGAIYLALKNIKTHVVYHGYTDPQAAAFFKGIRHPAIHWMQDEGVLQKSLRILKKNELIATAIDINYFKGGVPVSYFGHPKVFPNGPALFSVHTGAPILCAYTMLDPKTNKYITSSDEPIFPNMHADKKQELHRITQCIAKNLENKIRQNPEQWFIFEDFRT